MSTLLKVSAPIPEHIVQLSDGEGFAVRGLSPINVIGLYQRHMGELEPMFERIMAAVQARGELAGEDIQPFLLALIAETPMLMAELIVLGSGGDPMNVDPATIMDPQSGEPVTLPKFDAALAVASALPFPVQVDALSKIAELTFTQDMPPGKFVALVVAMIRKATGAMGSMTTFLKIARNGFGESGDPSIS